MHKQPLRIAVLTYQGCLGTEVLGLADVLRLSGTVAMAMGKLVQAPFSVELVALRGRGTVLAGGSRISAKPPTGRYDLLVVPGMDIQRLGQWDDTLAPLQRELAYLRKTFAGGTPIASVCAGAFLLGEAGLLVGRKATTAWICGSELSARYPTTLLQRDAVLVHDGAITTTGAVSAVFDLALQLVKQALGAEVASATARLALLGAPRTSQAPFVDRALLAPAFPDFSQHVAQWLVERLTSPYDLDRLAQAFHVSSRTLLRRIKTQTGDTPLALLQTARIERAKELLLTSSASLAQITEAVGYADVPTFSRLFTARVGESPARYRKRHPAAVS